MQTHYIAATFNRPLQDLPYYNLPVYSSHLYKTVIFYQSLRWPLLAYSTAIFTIKTYIYILARSLHDVPRANNNRLEVVVCFTSALRASKCKKVGNFRFCTIMIIGTEPGGTGRVQALPPPTLRTGRLGVALQGGLGALERAYVALE